MNYSKSFSGTFSWVMLFLYFLYDVFALSLLFENQINLKNAFTLYSLFALLREIWLLTINENCVIRHIIIFYARVRTAFKIFWYDYQTNLAYVP